MNYSLSKLNGFKNEKKENFSLLENVSQVFILSASAKLIDTTLSTLSSTFVYFLKYSSVAKARTHYNNKLEYKGFKPSAFLAIMNFILLGDWFNKSEEPGKVSHMELESNQKGTTLSSKNKECLHMRC